VKKPKKEKHEAPERFRVVRGENLQRCGMLLHSSFGEKLKTWYLDPASWGFKVLIFLASPFPFSSLGVLENSHPLHLRQKLHKL